MPERLRVNKETHGPRMRFLPAILDVYDVLGCQNGSREIIKPGAFSKSHKAFPPFSLDEASRMGAFSPI